VTKTAMMADMFLPLKPRSDIALLNGLIYLLIENDLVDRDYIARHTTGFEALQESVSKYAPENVSQITGLSKELLVKTALLYGNAEAPFLGWTMGVNHSTKGTETVNAINNLALVTGNVGRPERLRFRLPGSAMRWEHAKRICFEFAGLSQIRKCYRSQRIGNPLGNFAGSSSYLARSGVSGHRRGSTGKKDSRIMVIATNPVVSFPNLGVLQQSLETLDFLWCRTVFIRHRPRSSPILFCLPRFGEKKKEPIQILSGG